MKLFVKEFKSHSHSTSRGFLIFLLLMVNKSTVGVANYIELTYRDVIISKIPSVLCTKILK